MGDLDDTTREILGTIIGFACDAHVSTLTETRLGALAT